MFHVFLILYLNIITNFVIYSVGIYICHYILYIYIYILYSISYIEYRILFRVSNLLYFSVAGHTKNTSGGGGVPVPSELPALEPAP